jgi:hypothetical protein
MNELGSQTGTAAEPWAPGRTSRWDIPLTVRAILLDLDGTIMPSYKTLSAIQYIEEQFSLHCRKPSSFVDYCMMQSEFEVVYRDRTNPRAIFCFQEKGAADICDKTSALNAYLRPGHIPLGAGAVNRKIDQ